MNTATAETRTTHAPSLRPGRNTSGWLRRLRCQALTASSTAPAVRKQALIVCANVTRVVEFVNTLPMLVSSARPASWSIR
jgi:hypothetical protein